MGWNALHSVGKMKNKLKQIGKMITYSKYQINAIHTMRFFFDHSHINRYQRNISIIFLAFFFNSTHFFFLSFCHFWDAHSSSSNTRNNIQFQFFTKWREKSIKPKKVKMLILLFQGIIYSTNSWTKWPLFTRRRLKLCAIYTSKSPKWEKNNTHNSQHTSCVFTQGKKYVAMEIWRLFSTSANEFHFKMLLFCSIFLSLSLSTYIACRAFFGNNFVLILFLKLLSCWLLHQHKHCVLFLLLLLFSSILFFFLVSFIKLCRLFQLERMFAWGARSFGVLRTWT